MVFQRLKFYLCSIVKRYTHDSGGGDGGGSLLSRKYIDLINYVYN